MIPAGAQDAVAVVGYPIGGETISVTTGVVSRIEVTSYSHGATELLGIQIDAAINPGNSGAKHATSLDNFSSVQLLIMLGSVSTPSLHISMTCFHMLGPAVTPSVHDLRMLSHTTLLTAFHACMC